MDYENILVYVENLVESIQYEEVSMLEVQIKLQELAAEIEESIETSGVSYDGFGFDDLD